MNGSDTPKREESGQRTRRAYERPVIAWEEDFEPYVFSTCGKMPGQGPACAASRSS